MEKEKMADTLAAEEEITIKEKVLENLKKSNLNETSLFQIRKLSSEQLGLDLSTIERKKLVRSVVDDYLSTKDEEKKTEKETEETEEYDDQGNLIICRLSDKRNVTVHNYRGKTLISIREYYTKNGKDLPSSKGISLTTEQWASLSKNVPAIENAINKIHSRLNG